MKILLKNAKIIDSRYSFAKSGIDIVIVNGIIKDIGQNINIKPDTIFDKKHVSIGWIDLRGFISDPGEENKENINSGLEAAASGGFSDIVTLPNTNPICQSKGIVDYIKKASNGHVVNIHPLGALSVDTKGTQLSELQDLNEAGAVGFTDGFNPLWQSSLLLKSLQYTQSFNGLVMDSPRDLYLSDGGVVNESVESVKLGLKGIPSLSESIAIGKILDILRYAGGKFHFNCISTKESVKLIRAAKKEGLEVTADISSYQLLKFDSDLSGFDTNLKVMPPFRTKEDKKEIIRGLIDGTIDTIVSNHVPQDIDSKNVEFDQAEYGIINYETSFSNILASVENKIDLEKVIELITVGPRRILGLKLPEIKVGKLACLSVFDPNIKWTLNKEEIKSRSNNTPFIGETLTGRCVAVINNGGIYSNE